MGVRVGINGFGRIGRITFRTCFHNSEIQLTAINDPAIDIEYICYLIKFDSTHGKFRGSVTHSDREITINVHNTIPFIISYAKDQKIKVFQEKYPQDVPWDSAGVQYVIEASGMFTSLDKASGHLASKGVRRVIVTAPSVDVPMVILGVNNYMIDTGHKVISCASSTLYCLAPIIKILNDQFGVTEGFITSIHAMTPSLKPLDGLCLRGKHWRDHRSIHQNIIPAATGACKALGKILPQVKDKMTGLAFRVPIINVSVLDITVKLDTSTSIQEIVKYVKNASKRSLKNIITISNEDAVSSDFIGDTHSCILDVDSSLQLRPTFFKLICWYENEFSYACRVVDSIFYSEMQFSHFNFLTNKTTCLRTKIPKQIMLPNPDGKSQLTVHCDYVTTTKGEILCSNFNNNMITKSAPTSRPLLYRNALLTQSSGNENSKKNHETEKGNEIFQVWNDDCNLSDNSIKPNRNSLFHSCMTFGNQNSLQNTATVKVQERLESVKKEFSKILVITEDLLKKSYKSKIKLQCSGSDETKTLKSNVELKLESTINSYPEDVLINKRCKLQPEINSLPLECCEDRNNVNPGCCVKRVTTKTKISDCILANSEVKANIISKDGLETTSTKLLESYETECSRRKTMTLETDSTTDVAFEDLETTDTNCQLVKTIKTVAYAISDEVVDNVNNEFNFSDGMISKESYEANVSLEEYAHVDVASRYQCLEDKQKSNNRFINHMARNKKIDMHLIDEELKKRNIQTMNSDSNNVLSISSEHSTDNRCKIFDLNKNITSLKLTTECEGFGGISPCVSLANTVTTIRNGDKHKMKQDLYDKLDSTSATDSDNSFQINKRKSQVLNVVDLTNSLDDLESLDKICKIMEISDELSDQLFSRLDTLEETDRDKYKWSFKDLCERIKLDEFCNNVFGK